MMTTRRLLILDDDPLIGEMICAIAKGAAVESRFTTNPGEFFRVTDEWQPTHLAIDLVMPEMDGVQVMAELARRGCEAQIIITSGQGSRVLEAAGRSASWRGLSILSVISKPFSPAAFRRLLMEDRTPSKVDVRPFQADAGALYQVTSEEIRKALDETEFHLVYQPKVECATGHLAGFEALVRWTQPGGSTIPPDRFVPIAERCGLIDELTEYVLDEGIAWFSRLRNRLAANCGEASRRFCLDPFTLSINISARTLANTALMESIENRCLMWKLPPSCLIFELTETSAMEDPVLSLDLLTRMRLKGFQLSIDDFGTGFSSMLQLVRLPFSEIKVDKSFVMTAHSSAEFRMVIKSIVGLGRSLGLKCTAEGLEDESTLDYLREVGCDLVQGYHISRPLAPEAADAWTLGMLESLLFEDE